MGWFAMGLVDVLDIIPASHPGRGELIGILGRCLEAAYRVQDAESGVWYQVMDQGRRPGNYLEASGSCMYVYAAARSARLGYVPAEFREKALRGFSGIMQQFVRVSEDGLVNLEKVCSVAGLGGTPYRDGSYEYYVNEPTRTNDYKGVGPFILAAMELENA
jgi:unsaturated rhamnogalacturonyl hydrolase